MKKYRSWRNQINEICALLRKKLKSMSIQEIAEARELEWMHEMDDRVTEQPVSILNAEKATTKRTKE